MPDPIVERARALLGTPFRPQGRDAATGLDCAGLVIAVYGLDPLEFRRDYRLSGDHMAELRAALMVAFRRVRAARPGDLSVARVGGRQVHLLIHSERGFIHADSRLRRVVETPGASPWPLPHVFRLRKLKKAGS